MDIHTAVRAAPKLLENKNHFVIASTLCILPLEKFSLRDIPSYLWLKQNRALNYADKLLIVLCEAAK